jgi:hypothetical protein
MSILSSLGVISTSVASRLAARSRPVETVAARISRATIGGPLRHSPDQIQLHSEAGGRRRRR